MNDDNDDESGESVELVCKNGKMITKKENDNITLEIGAVAVGDDKALHSVPPILASFLDAPQYLYEEYNIKFFFLKKR